MDIDEDDLDEYWRKDRLERFCSVAFYRYKNRMSTRLGDYAFEDRGGPKNPDVIRHEILDAIMEEVLALQEWLIILALSDGLLDAEALRGADNRGMGIRSIFITEEET